MYPSGMPGWGGHSNLDMANSKSDALACPRGAAEPQFAKSISRSNYSYFENRTDLQSPELRREIGLSEKNEPAQPIGEFVAQMRNRCRYWLNCRQLLRGEYTASGKLADGEELGSNLLHVVRRGGAYGWVMLR